RRADLQLDVLGLAGIERQRIELLAAVLLGVGAVPVLRHLGGQTHKDLLAALVLDRELELEGRLGGPAQLRQLRRDRQLGRQVGGQPDLDRQRHLAGGALGAHSQVGGTDRRLLWHVDAQLERDAGIGGRERRRDRLSAADQRRSPARGGSGDRQRQPLWRKIIVLQSKVNR